MRTNDQRIERGDRFTGIQGLAMEKWGDLDRVGPGNPAADAASETLSDTAAGVDPAAQGDNRGVEPHNIAERPGRPRFGSRRDEKP